MSEYIKFFEKVHMTYEQYLMTMGIDPGFHKKFLEFTGRNVDQDKKEIINSFEKEDKYIKEMGKEKALERIQKEAEEAFDWLDEIVNKNNGKDGNL